MKTTGYIKNVKDKSLKYFQNRINKIYGENAKNYIFNNFNGLTNPLIIHCVKHNRDVYLPKARDFIYKMRTCKTCLFELYPKKMSSYEVMAYSYLIKNTNYTIEPQYIVSNGDEYLLNKPFDFLIKELNVLIEIDGDQHRRLAFGRSCEDLFKQQEIDNKKIILATQAGYIAKRFPTNTDYINQIEIFLKQFNDYPTGGEIPHQE